MKEMKRFIDEDMASVETLNRQRVAPMARRPLRIMHIIPSLDSSGGMENILVKGLLHSDAQKYRHTVCCVIEEGGLANRLRKAGIDVFVSSKRNRWDLSYPFRLASMLRKYQVDVVHTYSGVYRDGCLAARLARVPVNVHSDHGRFYPNQRRARWTHRFMTGFRDEVVCVSEDLRAFLIQDVGIPAEKVSVIYNGVEANAHRALSSPDVLKRNLGLAEDCLTVGIVGRLVPVKNHRVLLEAIPSVLAAVPKVRLLVVGDGPLRQDLEALAEDLKISDRVLFLGHRSDVPELLCIMDVVALSSLHEGNSIALLEAMEAGRPVVATAVGGNPELVVDGVTGLLVPPGEPEPLARAIVELLKDGPRRRAMGIAGRARVEKHFSIDAMVRSYESLYESLLRRKGLLP